MAKVVAQVVRTIVVNQTFYVEVDVPDDFDIEDDYEVRETIYDAAIQTVPVEEEIVDVIEEYIEDWKVVA
jgi:hypothetical protein